MFISFYLLKSSSDESVARNFNFYLKFHSRFIWHDKSNFTTAATTTTSVTRLGDFLYLFGKKISYKSSQNILWPVLNNTTFMLKIIHPLLGNIGKHWATFYSVIWSHWWRRHTSEQSCNINSNYRHPILQENKTEILESISDEIYVNEIGTKTFNEEKGTIPTWTGFKISNGPFGPTDRPGIPT